MNASTRTWIQRGLVGALWLAALLVWRDYQTSNDLSTAEAGQRFIVAIESAWWGLFAFVGAYLLRPVVLFPATIITIMAGVLFGPWVGVLVVVIAANASAMVAYGIGRLLGHPPGSVEDRDAADDDHGDDVGRSLVQRWGDRMRERSFETVFIMRLIFLPYDLVNYLAGAIRIRWTSFLLATALGSLPGTISFVLLGASLDRIDQGLDGIDPIAIVASVAIFVVSLLVARVVRRRYGADTPSPIASTLETA